MADWWLDFYNSLLQSRSYITTDSQSASLSWCQAHSGAQVQIFVTVRQLRICWYGVPSPTRGRVCRLQLLLADNNAVLLRSDSCAAHDHMLLSQIRGSPNLESQIPYLYPPEQGGPIIYPGTGYPFRRLLRLAGLRWILEPASTREVITSNYETTLGLIGSTTSKNVLDCCGGSCLAIGQVFLKCLPNCCLATDILNMSQYFFPLWLYSPLDLGRFFSFLILYTAGRTPWMSDQPSASPLPAHRTTQT
jgi:hypothetical protein